MRIGISMDSAAFSAHTTRTLMLWIAPSELSAEERAEVKKVAQDLLGRLKHLLVLNWRQKSAARFHLKLAIEDMLDTGLPRGYDKPLYEQKCAVLFGHVYETSRTGRRRLRGGRLRN